MNDSVLDFLQNESNRNFNKPTSQGNVLIVDYKQIIVPNRTDILFLFNDPFRDLDQTFNQDYGFKLNNQASKVSYYVKDFYQPTEEEIAADEFRQKSTKQIDEWFNLDNSQLSDNNIFSTKEQETKANVFEKTADSNINVFNQVKLFQLDTVNIFEENNSFEENDDRFTNDQEFNEIEVDQDVQTQANYLLESWFNLSDQQAQHQIDNIFDNEQENPENIFVKTIQPVKQNIFVSTNYNDYEQTDEEIESSDWVIEDESEEAYNKRSILNQIDGWFNLKSSEPNIFQTNQVKPDNIFTNSIAYLSEEDEIANEPEQEDSWENNPEDKEKVMEEIDEWFNLKNSTTEQKDNVFQTQTEFSQNVFSIRKKYKTDTAKENYNEEYNTNIFHFENDHQ
ncbi:hypothetical protein [[Mycoplasma] testudinis]|uniref:hypothetical protein n=1 Tax=[Mycoplasma] testudinis TaxID=33924 RepID=UPI0004874C6C|nr:hypothetical protein [[Mycoplasma] testudinis]